jgi:tetratricopeptide (TPR) repeat protein
LAWDVEKKCSALSDDLVHGRSLLKLGNALYKSHQWQEALRYMDHARTVFKAVGSTYNLASAYHSISWVHETEHRFSDALDAIEEAWKYAELTTSRFCRMPISLTFSRILFKTDQDTKAWKYIEISLINASYIGDSLYVARALEYMGYGYLRIDDYQNAYGAYEAAAEKYLGTVDALVAKVCKNNMARIENKQRNPHTVAAFFRPGLDTDNSKTLFNPPIQAFACELSISP